jgi:hypothetical protein
MNKIEVESNYMCMLNLEFRVQHKKLMTILHESNLCGHINLDKSSITGIMTGTRPLLEGTMQLFRRMLTDCCNEYFTI